MFFLFLLKCWENTRNFDGEIDAIYISLQNLFIWLQNCQNIVILSDSKAAIQAVASINCPKMGKIKEIQRIAYTRDLQPFEFEGQFTSFIKSCGPYHCRLQNHHVYIKRHHRGMDGSPADVGEVPMT